MLIHLKCSSLMNTNVGVIPIYENWCVCWFARNPRTWIRWLAGFVLNHQAICYRIYPRTTCHNVRLTAWPLQVWAKQLLEKQDRCDGVQGPRCWNMEGTGGTDGDIHWVKRDGLAAKQMRCARLRMFTGKGTGNHLEHHLEKQNRTVFTDCMFYI